MALTFASSTVDYVTHGSGASLDNLSAVTVMMWVKPEDVATEFHALVSKNQAAATPGLLFALHEENVLAFATLRTDGVDCAAEATTSNFANFALGEWLFIAFVTDIGNAARMLVGSRTAPPAEPSSYDVQVLGSGTRLTDASEDFVIGHGNDFATANHGYAGDVAVVHVVNTGLTNGEIIEQWRRPHVRADSVIFSHYGWAGTGTQPDWSGAGNPGTLVGSPTVSDHVPIAPGFGFDIPVTPSPAGPVSVLGIADFNLPALTLTGAGTVPRLGAADFNLPVPTLTAAGIGDGVAGIADFNMVVPTLTAAGFVRRTGIADFNLPALTLTAAGFVRRTGIADFNLPGLTMTGAGVILIDGIADFNLPVFTLTGVGAVPRLGIADFNLPVIALTAAGGTPGAQILGDADLTFPSLWLWTQGGVDIPMINIYSITGQTGADTGTAFTLERRAGVWLLNRDVLAQIVLGAGSATIHIEGSLDGGSTFADLVSSGTASAMATFNMPPIIRVRLSAATGATVNVYLDADVILTRVDS